MPDHFIKLVGGTRSRKILVGAPSSRKKFRWGVPDLEKTHYIIMFNLQGLSGISKMYQVPELKVVHELG